VKIVTNVKRGPASGRTARRAAQPRGAATPDADKIRKCVALLSTLPGRMGLSDLGTDDGGELSVTIDPDAPTIGEVMLKLVADPDEAAATEAIRSIGARLGVMLEQREQIVDNGFAAERLDGDLRDTDAWAGRAEQAAQDELYGILDELLSPVRSPLDPAERDRLATDAREVLAIREEERSSRKSERDRTLEVQGAASAELQQTSAEEHLHKTVAALRQGQPVDADDLDQALATFAALDSGEDEDPTAATPTPKQPRRRRPR
jgi:hypothetical protein